LTGPSAGNRLSFMSKIFSIDNAIRIGACESYAGSTTLQSNS
jgi:hypothetical protein